MLVIAVLCTLRSILGGIGEVYVAAVNGTFLHIIDNNQYGYLADSLLSGSLSLEITPPSWLINLDNPYDFGSRYAPAEQTGEYALWDYAFYNGKYYCYFGVVPAIVLYIPFRLVTGTMLQTEAAVLFLSVVATIGWALLLKRFANRYFPGTSNALLTLIFLLSWGGLNLCYLVFIAKFYSVAILSSLCVTFFGLWFWLGSIRSHGALNNARLFAGTFLMSLNFGCRPQFILACFLAIPIFWDQLFVTRQLTSKRGIKSDAVIIGAILLAVVPLGWYNYARFGSFLDWGSSYNLTGFDMPHYRQRWLTTASLLYSYLIQPPKLMANFPFVQATAIDTVGEFAPTEPMYGGYAWLVPFCLMVFLYPSVRKSLAKTKLKGLFWFCIVFAAIVLLVDTRNAGVTQRYFGDFGFYVMIASIIVTLSIWEKTAWTKTFVAVLVVCLLVCMTLGGLSFFAQDRYDCISGVNPEFFSQIAFLYSA